MPPSPAEDVPAIRRSARTRQARFATSSTATSTRASSTESGPDKVTREEHRTPGGKQDPKYKHGDWGFINGNLFANHRFQISDLMWMPGSKKWKYRVKNDQLISEATTVYVAEDDFLHVRYTEGHRIRKKIEGTNLVAVGEVRDVVLDDSGQVRYTMEFTYEKDSPGPHRVDLDMLLDLGWEDA